MILAVQVRLFRGLIKEVEEDVNKFLATHEVRIVQMTQSESGEHVSLTLLIEEDPHLETER